MAMRRFEIAQDSMLPNLRPGDEVVAVDDREPDIGDVVVFPHPRRDDFWLVKRMAAAPRSLGEDQAWVLSDNLAATLADSRTLGPVARDRLWTVVERLDADSFAQACRLLAAEDEALGRIVATHGMPMFWERRPGLETLVLLILEQQVSLESGAAMYRRLRGAVGEVTVEGIATLGADGLRSLGVTRQKARYLLDLATSVAAGDFSLRALEDLDAGSARRELLALRGVGPWTADAYLLSALRHPDVFPVGDRALQVGAGDVLDTPEIPSPSELEALSFPWRPVRAAAARLIWHAYLSERGRVEPPDPTLPHRAARDA